MGSEGGGRWSEGGGRWSGEWVVREEGGGVVSG